MTTKNSNQKNYLHLSIPINASDMGFDRTFECLTAIFKARTYDDLPSPLVGSCFQTAEPFAFEVEH